MDLMIFVLWLKDNKNSTKVKEVALQDFMVK